MFSVPTPALNYDHGFGINSQAGPSYLGLTSTGGSGFNDWDLPAGTASEPHLLPSEPLYHHQPTDHVSGSWNNTDFAVGTVDDGFGFFPGLPGWE